MSENTTKNSGDIVVIRKYANRRLYDTGSSSYVTLEDLRRMVRDGREFVVRDAKTGDDLTRSVLTQIILEEEAKSGQSLLPVNFLRRLISFYGEGAQRMLLPEYLDMMMNSFVRNQNRIQQSMQESLDKVFNMGGLGDVGRRNMEAFEKAMRSFNPFIAAGMGGDSPQGRSGGEHPQGEGGAAAQMLADMQKQLDAMRSELLRMGGGGDTGADEKTSGGKAGESPRAGSAKKTAK